MSAPLCRQCGDSLPEGRRTWATPVCFECVPPPPRAAHLPPAPRGCGCVCYGDSCGLEHEVTRLRAALAEIAALQTERSVWDADTCKDAFDIASVALDGEP